MLAGMLAGLALSAQFGHATLSVARPQFLVSRGRQPRCPDLNFRNSDVMTDLETDSSTEGEPLFLMKGVTTNEHGHSVDLRVLAMDSYRSAQKWRNGINDYNFGIINMNAGTSTDFKFQFLDAETGKPVALKCFYFTVIDLDSGRGRTTESVTVKGFKQYWLMPGSEVNVSQGSKGTTFTATKFGNGDDNPTDRRLMSDQQLQRSVGMKFEDTDHFVLNFDIASKGFPRNFLFSGWSNLIDVATQQVKSIPVPKQKKPKQSRPKRGTPPVKKPKAKAAAGQEVKASSATMAPRKASTTKASTAKASTTKASTAKASTTKASPVKVSTVTASPAQVNASSGCKPCKITIEIKVEGGCCYDVEVETNETISPDNIHIYHTMMEQASGLNGTLNLTSKRFRRQS